MGKVLAEQGALPVHALQCSLQKAGRAPLGEAQLEMAMKQEPPTACHQALKSIFPKLVPYGLVLHVEQSGLRTPMHGKPCLLPCMGTFPLFSVAFYGCLGSCRIRSMLRK